VRKTTFSALARAGWNIAVSMNVYGETIVVN
jgi:hypothetical protein